MKTISLVLKKSQAFFGGSFLKVFIFTLILGAPLFPVSMPVIGTAVTQAASDGGITDIPESSESTQQFQNWKQTIQKFAGILLLIACVLAGIMYAAGKKDFAMAVFIGAFVIYGGQYLLGVVAEVGN